MDERNGDEENINASEINYTSSDKVRNSALSRRRILQLSSLSVAGGLLPASATARSEASQHDSPESVLSIVGTGSRSDYTLSVSETLEKSTANGGSLNDQDRLTGSTVTGYVSNGIDTYVIASDIESLSLDGDAEVELNGGRIDPEEYPDHVISIVGSGPRADYSFSVGEDIDTSTANGASLNPQDEVSGSTAMGFVGSGTDSYTFSGELFDIEIEGDATVFLDGESIDPDEYSPNILSFVGTGPHAEYSFSVTDAVQKSTANGANINSPDEISGSTASGYVHNGTDSYVFAGDLESLALDGEATVERNGDHIDPAKYPDGVISFIGMGPVANYSLTVSGDLEKSNANGGSIDSGDEISGSTATGHVSGGIDSYLFDGELTELHLDGDAATTLNGDRIEPTTRDRLTISSDHSRTEYTLSVTDDLEKSTANGATIDESDAVSGTVASGHVFGGTDGYTFAGRLVFLDVDGDATVTLNGERLDPQQYNLLSIEGTGSRVEYSLSVSDRLEKSTANGASIGSEDRIDGSTASGAVIGGTDSYSFAGELESISIEGDANVTLNGSQLDTQSPGTWVGKAPLPVEQSDANGGVVDGRLYYFGGFGQGHNLDAVKRAFVYEPDYSGAGTWSRIEDLPRALWAPCGVATEDSLYSFGGAPSGSPYNGVDPSDEIFRYRPNDGWTNLTARTGVRCPYPNYTMTGVYNPDDGLIYCMGGGTDVTHRDSAVSHDDRRRPGTFDESRIWTFDPATERVSEPELARMPRAKRWLSAGLVAVDGRKYIHAIGGRFGPGGPTNTNFRFDVSNQNWTWAERAPLKGTFATTSGSVIDNEIYLVGARRYKDQSPLKNYTTECYRYDPVNDEFDSLPRAKHKRGGSVSGVIGGTLYVAGGHLKRYDENGDGYHDCVQYTTGFAPQ